MYGAIKGARVNDKFQDPLYLFLELVRAGVMHGHLWSGRAFSGGPSFGTGAFPFLFASSYYYFYFSPSHPLFAQACFFFARAFRILRAPVGARHLHPLLRATRHAAQHAR